MDAFEDHENDVAVTLSARMRRRYASSSGELCGRATGFACPRSVPAVAVAVAVVLYTSVVELAPIVVTLTGAVDVLTVPAAEGAGDEDRVGGFDDDNDNEDDIVAPVPVPVPAAVPAAATLGFVKLLIIFAAEVSLAKVGIDAGASVAAAELEVVAMVRAGAEEVVDVDAVGAALLLGVSGREGDFCVAAAAVARNCPGALPRIMLGVGVGGVVVTIGGGEFAAGVEGIGGTGSGRKGRVCE